MLTQKFPCGTTTHCVPIQPLLPQMTSDAKLAVFKEEFSGSAGWSGHAPPRQQRKSNLSQAPPAEIARAPTASKEKRETDSAASFCASGARLSVFFEAERVGPQLLAYPSQVKQLVFSLYSDCCNSKGRLSAPFLRESAAGSQICLLASLTSLVALISSDCVLKMVVREIKLPCARPSAFHSPLHIADAKRGRAINNSNSSAAAYWPDEASAGSELCELQCVLSAEPFIYNALE